MKKLILALLLAASFGYAGVIKEQSADVNANDVTGNFDSYNWIFMGTDSQSITLNVTFDSVTNDLSTWTMGWKASRMTRTGQVDYIVIDNSDITAGADGVVTFSITNTAIPPDASYKTELYGWQGAATNYTRTMAQGMVDVRQSLYENDAQFTLPTNSTVNWASVGQYLNTSSNGPYRAGTNVSFGANTDGSVDIDVTCPSEANAVIAGTNIDVVTNGTDYTVSAGSALATDAEVAAGYLDLAGTSAMTGDINMGGNSLTNAATVEYTGTTNVTQSVITIGATNYISWVLEGSSITNLMPLVYE